MDLCAESNLPMRSCLHCQRIGRCSFANNSCPNIRPILGYYCDEHKCKYINCALARVGGFMYCIYHKCSIAECKRPRNGDNYNNTRIGYYVESFPYCNDHSSQFALTESDHQCMFCEKRANFMSPRCDQHECPHCSNHVGCNIHIQGDTRCRNCNAFILTKQLCYECSCWYAHCINKRMYDSFYCKFHTCVICVKSMAECVLHREIKIRGISKMMDVLPKDIIRIIGDYVFAG